MFPDVYGHLQLFCLNFTQLNYLFALLPCFVFFPTILDLVTATASDIMSPGFHLIPVLMNAISVECFEGFYFNLAQTITWAKGRADKSLLVKGRLQLQICTIFMISRPLGNLTISGTNTHLDSRLNSLEYVGQRSRVKVTVNSQNMLIMTFTWNFTHWSNRINWWNDGLLHLKGQMSA